MIEALRVPSSQNLLPLSQLLFQQGIFHRISEYRGDQVVWVKQETDIARVHACYTQLGSQPMANTAAFSRPATRIVPWPVIRRRMLRSLITSTLIFISVMVTLGLNSSAGSEVFSLLQMSMPKVEQGQVWRLITPVFLHFNLMHLVFNMLMLWVFGSQVEARESHRTYILLLLVTALASNLGQYVVTGGGFGGMSGVVYGVLAFCWQWDRMNPKQAYGFPPALMGFMLFWLVLGYTDALSWAGFGHMANTAHLLGLVSGIACAFILSLLRIQRHRSKHPFQ